MCSTTTPIQTGKIDLTDWEHEVHDRLPGPHQVEVLELQGPSTMQPLHQSFSAFSRKILRDHWEANHLEEEILDEVEDEVAGRYEGKVSQIILHLCLQEWKPDQTLQSLMVQIDGVCQEGTWEDSAQHQDGLDEVDPDWQDEEAICWVGDRSAMDPINWRDIGRGEVGRFQGEGRERTAGTAGR